jgi:bifunctional pyridoxal-dependent enzyme with beta-cystathionase and maltose regulon repressor activities
VVPGSSFYAGTEAGRSSVRFNFAKHMATLEAAVQRLRILRPA